MPNEPEKNEPENPLNVIFLRDEILQVIYWMEGEGFGQAVDLSDLQKFLDVKDDGLGENLERMIAAGLIERAEEKYQLTESGRKEGGRRFADEFDDMLKPGHFECDAPDCDCHHLESFGQACKHLL